MQHLACSIFFIQKQIKKKARVWDSFHMYSLRKSGTRCCGCCCIFAKCMQKLPICSLVLLRFRTFLANVEFVDGYFKNPVSVTKKDISDHICQVIYISL